MQKAYLIIKDPEVAKLFADESRREILHLLRHKEMSPTDLAKTLEKNHSSIMHHLQLLKESGLIEQIREEKVRNMVQAYYRATAYRFIISYSLTEALTEDEGFASWREGRIQGIYDNLGIYGVSTPEEKRQRMIELISITSAAERRAFEETVEKQTDFKNLDRHAQWGAMQLLINIRLSRDPEYLAALRELDKLINL